MSRYYNTIAPSYDELHGDEQLEKLRVCMGYLSPKEDEKLLDVGCGTGISTEPWNCERYGIDPAEELIRIAKEKRSDCEYRVAAAEDIPFPDKSFDHVISITAIQNFNDLDKGLREIDRVLKDGGNIIITTIKDSQKLRTMSKRVKERFNITKTHDGKIDLFFIGKKA